MNKSFINNITRRLGFEVHGNGFLQAQRKTFFKEDAFGKQKELLNGKASVIFDLGANVGDVVSAYGLLFPGANIYGFEPFPETFEILKSKFQAQQQITTEQLALSDAITTSTFYVNQNVDTNSLLQPTRMGLSADAQVANKTMINVRTSTIDEYCSQHHIDSIDILKLDIQGGELAALSGASKLLKQKKIKLIYTEAYFREQYVDQPLFHKIADLLAHHDYYLQDLYNPIYGKGSIAWCDAIFLPAQISNRI